MASTAGSPRSAYLSSALRPQTRSPPPLRRSDGICCPASTTSRRQSAASRWHSFSPIPRPAGPTGRRRRPRTAPCRTSHRSLPSPVDEPLTILVAARDEETRIACTIENLRRTFADGEVIVADDGSRDRTADVAEAAGAVVLRLPRRGKGQALSAAERAAPPGRLLLCDADLEGDVSALLDGRR